MKGRMMPQTTAPKEIIPKVLLRAMFGLALASLIIASYASFTGRTPVGRPEAAAVLAERMIILQGGGSKAVKVLDADGTLLLDLPHGGFITVVQNAMETERGRSGIDPLLPLRLVSYANGRLTVEDPETGWSVETQGFGSYNEAAFRQLLTI